MPDLDFVFVNRADTENGRSMRGNDVWTIAERVDEARTGDTKPEPALTSVAARRFSSALPPRGEPHVLA